MAIKKVYTCDICGCEKDHGELVGMRRYSSESGTFLRVDKTGGDRTPIHLCLNCIDAIKCIGGNDLSLASKKAAHS